MRGGYEEPLQQLRVALVDAPVERAAGEREHHLGEAARDVSHSASNCALGCRFTKLYTFYIVTFEKPESVTCKHYQGHIRDQ